VKTGRIRETGGSGTLGSPGGRQRRQLAAGCAWAGNVEGVGRTVTGKRTRLRRWLAYSSLASASLPPSVRRKTMGLSRYVGQACPASQRSESASSFRPDSRYPNGSLYSVEIFTKAMQCFGKRRPSGKEAQR
jgi:hypothetical protein